MAAEKAPKRARPRGRLEILIKFLLGVISAWAVAVLTVFVLDLPSQGGSDKFCDSFYIPPTNPLDQGCPSTHIFWVPEKSEKKKKKMGLGC